MSQNSAVPFPPPQATRADPLTEVLRQGANRLLAQAIEAEVATWLVPSQIWVSRRFEVSDPTW